jgi:hypothetical protein
VDNFGLLNFIAGVVAGVTAVVAITAILRTRLTMHAATNKYIQLTVKKDGREMTLQGAVDPKDAKSVHEFIREYDQVFSEKKAG